MYQKQGFTLMELLVVVLIIGILASIAVPQYQKAVEKARLSEFVTQAFAIRNALRMYQLANGRSATKLSDLDIWTSVGESNAWLGKRYFFEVGSLPYFRTSGSKYFTVCEIRFDAKGGSCYAPTEKGKELARSMGWEQVSADTYYIGRKSDWQ